MQFRLGRLSNIPYSIYFFAIAALCLAAAGVAYVGEYRASRPDISWQQFATTTFAVSYPPGYIPDPSYTQDISPGRHAVGVKFTIDPKLAAGTNLSSDSYISVETLSTLTKCSATPYLYDPQTSAPLSEDGYTYSFARSDGAAAGNLYEEQVFVRMGEKRCLAVRYAIHSSNIADYYDGKTAAFNRDALIAQFDGIRRSLVVR